MTTIEDYHQTDPDAPASAPRRRRVRPELGVLDNPFTAQLVADEIKAWADHLDADVGVLPARTALLRQAAGEIEGRN